MTPQELIQLMRTYEKNPAAGIVRVIKMLRAEMDHSMKAELARMSSDFEKKMANMTEEVDSEIEARVASLLTKLRGKDGKDSDTEEVAKAILAIPGFTDMVRGEPGKPGDPGKTTEGKPGKDYILTATDKKEIAQSIKVPVVKQIVEKREIIKEQPIVTEVVREKAITDKPEEIAKKLNKTEESVDRTVIRGLQQFMDDMKQSVRSLGQAKPAKKIGGGGNIVEYYDLTSQCNGVTKTFTISRCRRVLSVHSTQFPIVYRPDVDWAATQTTITLTSEVSAPETGQTLYALLIR